MDTCIKCGKRDPEYRQLFAVVNASSASNTTYSGNKRITTTTTTESFAGADACAACEECVKKKRLGDAIGAGTAGLFGGTLLSILCAAFFTKKDFFNSHASTILLVCLGVGVVAAVLVFLSEMKEKAPFIMAKLLKKARGTAAAGKVFAPLDRSLYIPKNGTVPDINEFKKKTGLKTDVGSAVFVQLILAAPSGDLINSILTANATPSPTPQTPAAPQTTPAGTRRLAVPEGEHKALLIECVNRLLTLYKQTPGGFLSSSPEAAPVRAVGQRLNAAGGMPLMLEAHRLFADANPGLGPARNLESVWDGVGDWRG